MTRLTKMYICTNRWGSSQKIKLEKFHTLASSHPLIFPNFILRANIMHIFCTINLIQCCIFSKFSIYHSYRQLYQQLSKAPLYTYQKQYNTQKSLHYSLSLYGIRDLIVHTSLDPKKILTYVNSKPTIQITAATHLTTRLTATNFPIWRKQVEYTLVRLELEDFIIGDSNQHVKQIDIARTKCFIQQFLEVA